MIKKVGEWAILTKLLRNVVRRTSKGIRRAIARESLRYMRAMTLGIVRGAPGGQRFRELAKITVALKGGKSKPLIDRSDLLRSIKSKSVGLFSYFAGIHRKERGRTGKMLANIGEIHEFGVPLIIQKVTFGQHKFFRGLVRRGLMAFAPRIGSIIMIRIPARPFVGPVYRIMAPGTPKRVMRDFLGEIGILRPARL